MISLSLCETMMTTRRNTSSHGKGDSTMCEQGMREMGEECRKRVNMDGSLFSFGGNNHADGQCIANDWRSHVLVGQERLIFYTFYTVVVHAMEKEWIRVHHVGMEFQYFFFFGSSSRFETTENFRNKCWMLNFSCFSFQKSTEKKVEQ